MQSQTQYQLPNSPPGPMGSPKFSTQNYIKTFDKTLPTNTLKHYSSNPNLSLQINQPKSNTQPTHDFNPNPNPNKNNDFKNQPYIANYLNSPTHLNARSNRSELTKSLIITDMEKNQTPEETSSPKKELFKNMPRRAYRMSETIQDLPQPQPQPQPNPTNFYKNKQLQPQEQKKQPTRQAPSFLHRVNSLNLQMKRSLVMDPTFSLSRQWGGKGRKVGVDDFIKIKQLGNGKYGRVYLVRQRSSNFVCALKVIEKKLLHEQEITDQFTRQVKIQMFLNHPNIIKMYGCFHDKLNIYIILEVGTGGQLYHQLKKSQPLSEARIAFIMRQVCEAVNQIHTLRIIHRDIKPENIVLHDNIIKLCDFGWSVHQDNKLRTTFCGTPLYVCPQILKGREYDEKIDIWSIGIMMYEMVVGENPFKITKEEELIKIVKEQIKIPSYLFVSTEVRDFLDRCLQKNPNDRASIKQLVNHPFFKKHQDKNDKSKIITE